MRERLFQRKYNSNITDREINNSIISRKAAEEGFVLLKNNGTLPLKAKTNIALYGAGAQKTVKGGWGSGDVNERKNICIKEGLQNAGYIITTEKWINDYDEIYNQALIKWNKECEDFRNGNMENALNAANIPLISHKIHLWCLLRQLPPRGKPWALPRQCNSTINSNLTNFIRRAKQATRRGWCSAQRITIYMVAGGNHTIN